MKKKENLKALRHSTEHILTQAMLKLYPGLKMAMGPATEDGFYFDLEYNGQINESDFPRIEAEMQKIIDQDLPFSREELEVAEARKLFPDNPYKQEWLDEIEERDEKAVVYHTGDQFADLCAGPHVKSTGEIGAFKLLSVAGAYWRGNEKNPMLTRIYGTAFETQEELDEYLKMLAEAEKRDHRKIGKELDLFSFHPEGPGMPFWHPRGFTIFNTLINFWREQQRQAGYTEVKCPDLLNVSLWKQSGHFEHYKESMFFSETEKGIFALRPMDCPGAILIYKTKPRSYRDLPMRLSELGTVYRNEKSGELHGLLRVQQITQDDAHLFVTKDQIKSEISTIIKMVGGTYKMFGLDYRVVLSTRPRNYMGEIETWNRAEKNLEEALKESKIDYKIDEGEGAFYGPKIDFWIKDSLGRAWQCATIQLDFFMPKRFDLEYIAEDGEPHRPVIIHRVIMGALERFIGILIEHYAGNFPVWLAPVQVMIIPVSEKQNKYAQSVEARLIASLPPIRVEIDDSDETLEKKIRGAQLQKIPYMLIAGSREEEVGNEVALRLRSGKDLGAIKVDKFKDHIQEKINTKSSEL